MTPAIDAIIRPLDAVRREFWRLSARTEFGRRCLREPAYRLQYLALGHVASSLVLTLVAPMWLLLLGPLLLGIPHVASDIRYFVLKPPFVIRSRFIFVAPLLVMVAVRALSWAGLPWTPLLEISLGFGTAAALLLLVPLTVPRRLAALAVLGAVWVGVSPSAYTFLLVFAHGHNLVAALVWFWLFAKEARPSRVAVVALGYFAAGALIMSGIFDGFWSNDMAVGGFSIETMVFVMAPGFDFETGIRLVMLFAFAQSFHYAIWLRLVPQSLDPRPAPPTFARAFRRLRDDFGGLGLASLVGVALAVPALALLWDAEGARNAYLITVVFHGWLELAVLAALLAGAGAFRPSRGRGA